MHLFWGEFALNKKSAVFSQNFLYFPIKFQYKHTVKKYYTMNTFSLFGEIWTLIVLISYRMGQTDHICVQSKGDN